MCSYRNDVRTGDSENRYALRVQRESLVERYNASALNPLAVPFRGCPRDLRKERHISIDVLSRILPERITRWSNLIIDCLALIVVGILAYYGFIFLQDEQLSEAVLIGSVPLWWAKAIIPYGFVLIGIHLFLQIGIHLMGGEQTPNTVEGASD